jgi:hypothetical protein
VARDETAWTWWTLSPAIAGCWAQRYRWSHRSCPCWIDPSAHSRPDERVWRRHILRD